MMSKTLLLCLHWPPEGRLDHMTYLVNELLVEVYMSLLDRNL